MGAVETSLDAEDDRAHMSFVDHLRELRQRIIASALAIVLFSLIAYGAFRNPIFNWFIEPLHQLPKQKLQVLGLVEMFVTYLKLSILVGVFAAMPWILWQFWRFVAPGLYKHERRWASPFVVLGTLFFISGGAFAFYVVLPFGFQYLVSMVPEAIEANYRVSEYVGLVVKLLLAFGLVFELPLVMWILSAADIVGPKSFARFRKYWVVVAVVLAAFLTPPDPLTQMMMATPLIVFFELGIVGARVLYRKKDVSV